MTREEKLVYSMVTRSQYPKNLAQNWNIIVWVEHCVNFWLLINFAEIRLKTALLIKSILYNTFIVYTQYGVFI